MLPNRDLLKTLAQGADKNFFALLLGCYAAAAVLPEAGVWLAHRTFGHLTIGSETAPVSLGMLLLACLLANAGMGMELERLRHLLRQPVPLLVGLLANLLVPVLFILCLAQGLRWWHDPDQMQNILVAIGLIAAMPIAGSATAWSQKSNGDLSLSLGLVLGSTLLSMWTTPLTLRAVGLVTTGEHARTLHDLAGSGTGLFLFAWVLAPTVLGMLVRAAVGNERVRAARPVLKVLSAVTLLLLIYINSASALPQVLDQLGLDLLAALLGIAVSFCTVAFTAGWLVAQLLRVDRGGEIALIYGLGMNNNGTGLVLASATLSHWPQVSFTIVCYNLVQHLVAGCVDFALARQGPAEELALDWSYLLTRLVRPFRSFGFTLVTAVLLTNACASYWNVRSLDVTYRRVSHNHEVITLVQSTLGLLKDAETGQRGFLLTGREHYLEPYHEATAVLHDRLKRLQELTVESADQQGRLRKLEARIAAKFEELHETLRARQEGGLDAAVSALADDRGKQEMDSIRRLMGAITEAEEESLETWTAEAEARLRRALLTIVVLSVLVLIYHLLAGWRGRLRRPPLALASRRPVD